jgi:hypothetical protein
VNKRGDEIAQLATEYSAVEIAYFKALVRLPPPCFFVHPH